MEWKLVKRDCSFCSKESVLLKQIRHTKKTEAVIFFKKDQEATENMQKMTLTTPVSCISEVVQSCLTLWNPMDLLPWSLVGGAYQTPPSLEFSGKSTGVGGHFLLQEIFPTQGLNLGLLHCRQTVYRLSH